MGVDAEYRQLVIDFALRTGQVPRVVDESLKVHAAHSEPANIKTMDAGKPMLELVQVPL